MHVDLVLDQQLLHLAAPNVGLGLVIRHVQLDGPAVDAAGFVDAVDRHLHADQRGLAAGGARAGKRLLATDLVALVLAEGGLPWRRHQHARTERACGCSVSDQAAARDFAAVPELLGPIVRLVSHCEFLPGSYGQTSTMPTAALAGG